MFKKKISVTTIIFKGIQQTFGSKSSLIFRNEKKSYRAGNKNKKKDIFPLFYSIAKSNLNFTLKKEKDVNFVFKIN